ncbi:MAG: hypothetical protein WC777_00665 [Candidatus Gracilibacteria bacterium]|jgi:uncharacterized protein YuzE
MEYPNIVENGKTFSIQFKPSEGAHKIENIDLMVDLDSLGETIGIELLDMMDQTKSKCIVNDFHFSKGDELSISYDPECDAAYIAVKTGKINKTLNKKGTIFTGSKKEFLGLAFEK